MVDQWYSWVMEKKACILSRTVYRSRFSPWIKSRTSNGKKLEKALEKPLKNVRICNNLQKFCLEMSEENRIDYK